MKILVIQQKMIGDVLTSTIICESLKKQFPKATIHYLVNTATIPVILNNPFVDQIIEFTPECHTHKIKLYSFLQTVKNHNYDWVVDAYGKLESNLVTLFSGAAKKTSYKKWYTSFLYTHTIRRHETKQTNAGLAIENRLRLVGTEVTSKAAYSKPKIYLTKKEIGHAKTYLQESSIDFKKPLVMISVLGSSLTKTLPFDYMATTINTIVETLDCTIIYNYIPSQAKDAQQVFNLCNKTTQQHTRFDVFGKSLREFLAILHHCDFLIGNEGGAVNMAKALNIPTFTIFSPWINKEGWNLFESEQNVSVHLKDYKPQLYAKPEKEYKSEALTLYKKFTPNFFKEDLQIFIKHNKG